MTELPKSLRIIEVSPRDGLQIESKILNVEEKLRLINALLAAGIAEVEVGSFVNPKAVPQMAGTADVVRQLPVPAPGVRYNALYLNARGLDDAIASGRIAMEGKLTLTASETFVKRNTNRTIEQTISEMPEWIARYEAAGIRANRLGIMAAFGCNFEGDVPAATVLGLVERVSLLLVEHDCKLERLSLSDTMGWANPLQVKRLVGAVLERWPELTIKLHLHDTRGCAMANAFAGMELGVREFDSSIGGMGGCPFAGHKGAAGNICTEDLVFMCNEMGIETGIDIDAAIEAAKLAEELVGHALPGKVMKGGSLGRFRVHP